MSSPSPSRMEKTKCSNDNSFGLIIEVNNDCKGCFYFDNCQELTNSRCPDCYSRSIETLWVQPEKPEEPYRRWWCLDCGAGGIVVPKEKGGVG